MTCVGLAWAGAAPARGRQLPFSVIKGKGLGSAIDSQNNYIMRSKSRLLD